MTYESVDEPATPQAPSPISLTPFSVTAGGQTVTVDVFNDAGGLQSMLLGVVGRQYTYDPVHGHVTITEGASTRVVPVLTGSTFASASGYGYVVGYRDGSYTVNAEAMFPYSATTTGAPATHALMTAPQMFTIGGNFFTFDRDAAGGYASVTGRRQTYPVNPYQFSINGVVYIIDTSVQPNTVVGGGNVYPMTSGNTQFVLNGAQYTITLKQGSLNGATISGQFNVVQGNVVVIEDYVYQLDTLNGQVVGNGTTYPLTSSGVVYTITTADRSFTVTSEPNAISVTVDGVVFEINNTTVVGDGVVYPILEYRSFTDGATTYRIGNDGTVSLPTPIALSGAAPFTQATFTDGATFTVNDIAAFDGTTYFRIIGTPSQFVTPGATFTLRSDAFAIPAGGAKTHLVGSGAPNPNELSLGTQTIFVGRPTDVAAFDGARYYAIAGGQFTDTTLGATYTLHGTVAVHEGNSYQIYSNLGQGPYFEVPGGPVYRLNIPVADTGSASGDMFDVFPVAGGQFTIPLRYTITVAGGTATVDAFTFTGGPTAIATLTAAGGSLTGGFFTDPVTDITYTCVVDGTAVTFVDSNNAAYPFPAPGTADTLVANVAVATNVSVAVDDQPVPTITPVVNNQFVTGTTTYTVNVPIAYENPAGPYWPMVNGRFVVPRTDPLSDVAYTVQGGRVTKGYPVSIDDQFSVDGNVVYTINAVNGIKATNQATLSGAPPTQTLVSGPLTYTLDENQERASIQPPGLAYVSGPQQLTVDYDGLAVTYTVGATTATDDRQPQHTFAVTSAGPQRTFTDTVSGVTFSFDSSGDNPVTASFVYTNDFFADPIAGVTYFVDVAGNRVEALSYFPEKTEYAFATADGETYLIHYSDVRVQFPVTSGDNVNAGVATVGANRFTIDVDEVQPVGGGAAIPTNRNSFEINGNLYTITGTPVGADYSGCSVVGNDRPARPFTSSSTFQLSDPAVTYTLHLDADDLPAEVTATFVVRPSRNLLTVNDDVYVITYISESTGSLLGQGQSAIPITNSGFTLTNRFDTTKAKFVFADLNIFNAGSVVGQFTVYLAPTFFIDGATYTFDPVRLIVTDGDKRPYPLVPDPLMFSINGANYLLDTNRIPHAVVGNDNASPIATNVTVEAGKPLPHSTFTVGGLVYKFTEDANQNLLTITGTRTYPIAQPAGTFKLDSSLVFTLDPTPPAPGSFPGSAVPIGTATAGTLVLNIYPGTPESGGADFFTYKNGLYTLIESNGAYVAVQKSYTVYASSPVAGQQQLAVFDLDGTTYLVTTGTTTGTAPPVGINPDTLWAATSTSAVETQFGLVYGFASQPTTVTRSASGLFQFLAPDTTGTTTLYDVIYTEGGNANVVKVDVPALLPTFTQAGPFAFTPSYPLIFETGGYNAFTTFVAETATPSLSFAGAYKTPVTTSDPLLDTLMSANGDFSLEFWHSIPTRTPLAYHPVRYSAGTADPLVHYVDVDFEDDTRVYVGVNNTVVRATAAPPVFSSGWRHVAVTYQQPYTMLCQGAGFEVKKANSYNFNRDFSIAMTFSATDVDVEQGLLYKGTGSDVTPPQLEMSYRVGLANGHVTLQFTDGSDNISPTFVGPAVTPDQFFQLIVVKHTRTPAGRDDSADPYAAPFETADLGSVPLTANVSGFPEDGGDITISDMAPGTGANPRITEFVTAIASPQPKGYTVTLAVRTVLDDGTFGAWVTTSEDRDSTTGDPGLIVNSTGAAHLLIGAAFDDDGTSQPFGGDARTGNVRQVYLFNTAINPNGILVNGVLVDIASATADDLLKAGLLGYWTAVYDPDGLVTNPFDPTAVAISTNQARAFLAPLAGHEREGVTLYLNGYKATTTLVAGADVPPSMTGYTAGQPELTFNGGLYRLAEIAVWQRQRQQHQVVDDMFGRLVPTNEPYLAVYLSGSFLVQAINAPILPMNKYINNVEVTNPVASLDLAFSNASLDLAGCPAVGRCGPLVTPNLYTPPGVALTVCDTVPFLATYSVTLNSVTGSLAGEVKEAYVYIKNDVLTLYAGKKVGDLVLSWVSQEQGDVQLIGYVEGAPPAPMANLTNKASYAGATSLTLSAPTSLTMKLTRGLDSSTDNKLEFSDALGFKWGAGITLAPFGVGVTSANDTIVTIDTSLGGGGSYQWNDGDGTQVAASNKLDQANRYTVRMQGALAPVTNDLFMSSLNSVSTPSATPGNAATRSAILPNPNLGGFTSSNPPAALPKVPAEEKFGSRMFQPAPYGQAFVTSQTLDVYQQTLVQTNTVYGFVRVPNAEIPRDLNIVSFRINSQYLRPGVIDGVVGYTYNPATLSTGAKTYTTSTGQMQVLYDKNFPSGSVGHDASYMRVVEAYRLKREIDQQAFNALAVYQSQYDTRAWPTDSSLTPGLDFYNEYLWTARGGTQEVKHTYTTSYDEVYSVTNGSTADGKLNFNFKLVAGALTVFDLKFGWTHTEKYSVKTSYNTTGTTSFDIAASFDGIENDTQMRYASNNDAHFVMKFNSMYNPSNQSGLNLVVGSDGLVYNIAQSVASGAGIPQSNNLDDSMTYSQPQPAYAAGNATGPTGAFRALRPAGQGQAVPYVRLLPAAEREQRRELLGHGGGSPVARQQRRGRRPGDALRTRAPFGPVAGAVPRHVLRAVPAAGLDGGDRRPADRARDGGARPRRGEGLRLHADRSGSASRPQPRQRPRGERRPRRTHGDRRERRLAGDRRAGHRPTGAAEQRHPVRHHENRRLARPLGRHGQRQAPHPAHHVGARPQHRSDVVHDAARIRQGRRRDRSRGRRTLVHDLHRPQRPHRQCPRPRGHHGVPGRERQPDPVLRRRDVPLAPGRLRRHQRRHRHLLRPAAVHVRPVDLRPRRRLRPVRPPR